jgi:hypothetical protein
MLTFGVEIECLVPTAARTRLHQEIVAAGVPCRDVMRYHSGTDRDNWKLEVDGSLRPDVGTVGIEVVSPPLELTTASFEQIEKVCRVLNTLDASVNRSCGLHVHVGLASVPVSAVRKLAALYAEHEGLIDQLIPPSRRGNANNFCQSVATRANMASLAQANTIRDVSYALNGDNKYYKLNLNSYWRYSTVEFRHHSGTVDAAKIIKWVTFVCKMVEAAIRDANVPIAGSEVVQADPYEFHRYWRSHRHIRQVFRLLTRPEGATGEEIRQALGRRTRPDPRYYLRQAEASTTPIARRDGLPVYRLGNYPAASNTAPVATPATLAELYDKLALDDADKEFWRERATILSSGTPRRRAVRAVAGGNT